MFDHWFIDCAGPSFSGEGQKVKYNYAFIAVDSFSRFPVCYTLKSSGRGGVVVGRPTAVREDPGSNLTAAGCVYHDRHCDIQPWARVVHPYCSA